MKSQEYQKYSKLYDLLIEAKAEERNISCEEILNATGWKQSTFSTYYAKKFKNLILIKESKHSYKVKNINNYDLNSFLRLMSQNQYKSERPFEKELKEETKILLEKAINSAYLAVDIYNRPQTKFRTEGYLVMMIIAWTALIQSIFEEQGNDYFHKDKNGNDMFIDGEKRAWELNKCIKNFKEISEATKKNIEFSILLRNKIEHRFIPEIDMEVCSECHSLLYNFEDLVDKKYGRGYSLATNLVIPIQLTRKNINTNIEAKKRFQSENFEEIKKFINNYRNSLDDTIYNSMEYSFKVYLVPKIVNRQSQADLAIEFVDFNPQDTKVDKEIQNAVALIKQKYVPVVNLKKYKPSTVAKMVSEQIEKPFSVSYHTNAWKFYRIRDTAKTPFKCDTNYCLYDDVHGDIVYTDKWVEKLTRDMQDDDKYEIIKNYRRERDVQ